MKYKCPKCGKIVDRTWKTKEYKNRVWFKSYCDEKQIMTRLYKIRK